MNWSEHIKNRQSLPEKELAKYYGKHVAWSNDGTRIVASGDDDLQVFEAAQTAGYSADQIVFSYVPYPDEVIIASASRMPREARE